MAPTLPPAARHAETGPFGPADGSRADLDDIRRDFVDFADQPMLADLASPANDRSARLIVGKKGVGKTIYLKRFHDDSQREKSVYTPGRIQHDVPATEDVIRVCELYPASLAAEGWRWIWTRAILRALVSHILCVHELERRLHPDEVASLERDYTSILRRTPRTRSVYGEARAIATQATSRDRLARELRHPDWDDLEEHLGEILAALPPICFYLDSVDEQFGSAPLYWLQCQKGLCNAVLELFRDPRFGNRLHVVVSVRDLVRSSLMSGEHATRHAGARHIRVLEWDHPTIRYFLHEKIRRLPAAFLMDRDADAVPGWLGRDELYNPARGVTEDLEDYLLRHTRQIPRDVVQLGNQLSDAVAKAKGRGEQTVSDEALRRAVGVVSKLCADEQIAVCANHLASDTMPPDAGRRGFSGFYTSDIYSQGVQGEICELIRAVGIDRFPMARLKTALANVQGDILRSHGNPIQVLWLNGLLGYDPPNQSQRRSHFYGAVDVADYELPEDLKSYVFHPIVGHKVRIDAAGVEPVRPFG